MTEKKKAFVIMPFGELYDGYYPEIFRPSLEDAGYHVSRADDVFAPGQVMLDVQNSILDADVVLCEMSGRNPNVLYELGFSHAVGKPAILVSRREEDIPFDLRHLRVILYDHSRPGWEAKLKEAITVAARAVTESGDSWAQSPTHGRHEDDSLEALAGEILFNLSEIDTFLDRGYALDDSGEVTASGKPTTLRYVSCMTAQFASAQPRIAKIDREQRDQIFQVYRGFREINTRAEALKQAFRPWRASQYFDAIADFQSQNRELATKLSRELQGD